MQIIKINDVHKCVTKKFPLTLQEKWDSSGVIVYRNLSEQVTGIVLCLDVNQGTVDEAIKCGANLIIAHHPVHLKSKSAKPNKYTSDLLKRIKDNHLTLIVYHTNVDNHLDGLNNFVAKELGLSGIKNIKGTSMVGGHLKFPYRPKVFASTMISKFGLERVLFVSDNLIKNVVICAGSGFDIIQEHADKLQNIDAVVTGDVCWHDWQFAAAHDLHIMDVGHDLENAFISLIAETISHLTANIGIRTIPSKLDIKIVS